MTRRLVFSQGDPQGIGPELLLQVAAAGLLGPDDLVFAGASTLERCAASLVDAAPTRGWPITGWRQIRDHLRGGDELGQVSALRLAVDEIERCGDPRPALVTAPIDKKRAHEEGLGAAGHTEYLAARAGVEDFAMLMAGPRLRVVLATIHIPLAAVPTALSRAAIVRAGRLLAHALVDDFAVIRPRIGVLGLNPHAGEGGLLGDEEARFIGPAVAELARMEVGVDFSGPLPADGAFPLHASGGLDGIVAMYHDQGLGPFKLLHFHEGVNVTLGLPYLRTSPDHGTARDLVGRGLADPRSMFAATRLARGPTARDAWST